jgi:hypothetical protein
VASVVAFTVFIYFPFQSNSPNQGQMTYVLSGATISGGTCEQSIPSGLVTSDYSNNRSIVFIMKPNSTAELCVSYRVQENDLPESATFGFSTWFGVQQEHLQCSGNICSGYGRPGPFNMSASPPAFTVFPSNNISKLVIMYIIHSGSNSQGFYSLQYLNSCTRDIPLVAGYGPSEVNASDFIGFFPPPNGCGTSKYFGYLDYLSDGIITGITNLNYTYINANFTEP